MDNQEKTPINWDLLKKNIVDSFNELNQESKESYDKLFKKWTELGEKYLAISPKLVDNTWYINFINDFMPVTHDFRKNASNLNTSLNETVKYQESIIANQVLLHSESQKKIKSLEAEIAKLKASQENSKSVMFGKNIVSFQDKKDEKKFDAMLFDLEQLK